MTSSEVVKVTDHMAYEWLAANGIFACTKAWTFRKRVHASIKILA